MNAHADSVFDACLKEALLLSAEWAPRWLAALGNALQQKEAAAVGASEQRSAGQARATLAAYQQRVTEHFLAALSQSMGSAASGQGDLDPVTGKAPARRLDTLSLDDLELMDHQQVQHTVELARIQQVVTMAVEEELVLLDARLSTARGLTVVEHAAGHRVHIVPGLIQRGDLPNVMRGEETQVLGVMAGSDRPDQAPVLIGLPGTHSKWVLARRRSIEQFHTFMTGEVFAALRGHTILGRTMQAADAPDDAAFARGLQVARSAEASLGLLSHIFSTRTLGLTGALPGTAQADYLSGLLIGHEVAALAAQQAAGNAPTHVVLCGEPDLRRRYALALAAYGLPVPEMAENATARGLWQIATAAGLTTPSETRSTEAAR